MYIDKARAHHKQAEELLTLAQEELFKSKDDVVLYTACSKSRQSIRKFLLSYLYKNGFHPETNDSISELLRHCTEIDPRFRDIHVDVMLCSGDKADARYCTDINKVQSCVDIAVFTKEMVDLTSDHWPLSKNVK